MPQDEEAPVVNEQVEEVTTAPESTPEETKEPVSEQPQETEGEQTEEPVDADETEEKPKKGAEARKEQLQNEISELEGELDSEPTDPNTEIRSLVAHRNELKRQVEQRNAEVYKPASVDELLDQINPETQEYYNKLEATVESMRQQQEVDRYNSQVADSQFTLETESQQVLKDFPMFNPKSPEYDKESALEVAEILKASLIVDPNTQEIIGSNISPYKLYKSHARAAQSSARKAEIKGQKATEDRKSVV